MFLGEFALVCSLVDKKFTVSIIYAYRNGTGYGITQRQRSKDEDSTDTMCCVTDGDPWSAKQHHWKSQAKEDHQLSPGGPSKRRKLWFKPTKIA